MEVLEAAANPTALLKLTQIHLLSTSASRRKRAGEALLRVQERLGAVV